MLIGLIFCILGSKMEKETIDLKDIFICISLGPIITLLFIGLCFRHPTFKRWFSTPIFDFRKVDEIEEELDDDEEDDDFGK